MRAALRARIRRRGVPAFYDDEMLLHFLEQEEQVLPLLPADGDRDLVTRTLLERTAAPEDLASIRLTPRVRTPGGAAPG